MCRRSAWCGPPSICLCVDGLKQHHTCRRVYTHLLRNPLITKANNELIKSNRSIKEKQLIQLDPYLMFKYIMQSENTCIINLLSNFLHEAFKLREQMLRI